MHTKTFASVLALSLAFGGSALAQQGNPLDTDNLYEKQDLQAQEPASTAGPLLGEVRPDNDTSYGGTAGMVDSPDTVRQIQQSLRDQGYNLRVDGIYGPETRSAIMAYQRDQGLSPSGTIDNQLAGSLGVDDQQALSPVDPSGTRQ